jgi:hypothetical protein
VRLGHLSGGSGCVLYDGLGASENSRGAVAIGKPLNHARCWWECTCSPTATAIARKRPILLLPRLFYCNIKRLSVTLFLFSRVL